MANITNKANILIVDDEEPIRRPLRKKLSKEGYVCREAGNAVQALETLRDCIADLVILDIMMPGKSGVELLPEIRSEYSETAVIMATAVAEIDIVIECMRQGAQDYITKPFDLDEVLSSVEGVLTKRNLEIEIKKYQQQLKLKVDEQTEEIQKTFIGSIEALVYALEAKDEYTAGHSRRVSEFAEIIGREMSLSSDELDDLRWGALLHDIGKIAIDPSIQNKPGKLTPEEYRHIMVHAQAGTYIVKPVVNDRIVSMILHHHDHYDGNGFDQSCRGEDIPLSARILAISDTFDAMTSARPYRSALPLKTAVDEIKRCSGTQLDPKIVKAFLKVHSQKKILV